MQFHRPIKLELMSKQELFFFLKQHYISSIHFTTTQYIHFSSLVSHTSIFRLSSFHMIKILCIGYNIYSILFHDSHFPSAYGTTIISYKHVLPQALTSTGQLHLLYIYTLKVMTYRPICFPPTTLKDNGLCNREHQAIKTLDIPWK